MWRLVRFFSSPVIRDLAPYGPTANHTLSESDIVRYLAHRLDDSLAFERVTQVLLSHGKSDSLHNQVLQLLKEKAALSKGRLPLSFEPAKLASAYARVKAHSAKG